MHVKEGLCLGETGKERDRVVEDYPNLAMAIHNQIARADLLLAIVFPDTAFRKWIEFEYQEAYVLGKSIIAVLHPELTNEIPPYLSAYTVSTVKWDILEIIEALRSATDRIWWTLSRMNDSYE